MATSVYPPLRPVVTPTIYDSQNIYPISYPGIISRDDINTLNIPSSRYFYYSPRRHRIPIIAASLPTVDSDQLKRDISAWEAPTFLTPTPVYITGIIDASDEPQIDFFSILEGKQIRPSEDARRRDQYIRDFIEFFRRLSMTPNVRERFVIGVDRDWIITMMEHPFNPEADYVRANQITQNPSLDAIRQYLNDHGITHLRAEDIINSGTIFFYLTRFYGLPVEGNLQTQAIGVKYSRRALNERTRSLVQQLSSNTDTYLQFQPQFDQFFEAINNNPALPIEDYFSALNREMGYRSFFDYLKLLRRPSNLPILTLNTIRQLNTNSADRTREFLRSYTDREILDLVGVRVNRARTRSELLTIAANELVTGRVFLLNPTEAALCRNPETTLTFESFSELGYAFLGKGSIGAGFDCYNIGELVDSFQSHIDANGVITFKDPIHMDREFTIQDLRDFRDALASGRSGVTPDPAITRTFDYYVNQAELQQRSDYRAIVSFRQFAAQSPANRDLVRRLFMQYFYMAMYMRQWRGPGNPYPIIAEATGTEAEVGTQLERTITDNIYREGFVFRDLLNQLPENLRETFWNFRVLDRVEGRVADKGKSVRERWNEVVEQRNYCFRMASAPWAFTAAYYLKQILNEDIAGFELGRGLEFIH